MSFEKIALIILLGLIAVNAVHGEDAGGDIIKLNINDEVFDVRLENNSATEKLIEILEKENITIHSKEYGGFEKVGDLNFSLPTNDEYINTESGDIVLYQGNQISLFYDSHEWSYTKIGKIENVSSDNLKTVLGSGDVTLVLSLK